MIQGHGQTARFAAQVGNQLHIDTWNYGYTVLEICDDWDGADFRVEDQHGNHLAVNVELVGRKIRFDRNPFDRAALRVKVTFPGDGEEDQVTRGWMVADEVLDWSL